LKELEQKVDLAFPCADWTPFKTLVAVSGGPDSVAVLRALLSNAESVSTTAKESLIIAHVNHGLRGSESDRDAQFVANLAAELNLPFIDRSPESNQISGQSEEDLRNFRYQRLQAMANQSGARYLVMGHNLDDQAETILFRFLRGTGIGGLAGIPSKRLASDALTIVRPLLSVSRFEITQYLNEIGQKTQEDKSNLDSNYTRNFLRNELIPVLKDRFGISVTESITRLGNQAREMDGFLIENSQQLDKIIEQDSSNQVVIRSELLKNESDLLVRTWLRELWIRKKWPRQAMSSSWWSKISQALSASQNQVLNLPCNIRFEKTGSKAIFTRQNEST
jgi:tRNA(Ile)-lysidine synthase